MGQVDVVRWYTCTSRAERRPTSYGWQDLVVVGRDRAWMVEGQDQGQVEPVSKVVLE